MRKRYLGAGFLSLAFAAAGAAAHEADDRFDEAQALAYSQAVVGEAVGDHAFRDERGRTVRIADYRGRPLVISMIYTSCTDVCPVVTQSIEAAVDTAQEALGGDSFATITIGFDTAVDIPPRMRAYRRGQGIDLPNWSFLSADHRTVDALAKDLGFLYYASPQGFDHLTQTTILDGEGRVYRQVYGEGFVPPLIVEPLKQLTIGAEENLTRISGIINQVRLFCTIYNPSSGRYRFDYSLFVGMIVGILSLGAVGAVLFREWRRTRRIGDPV